MDNSSDSRAYNLYAIHAPTTISIQLKGKVVPNRFQCESPILAVATQKITKIASQTQVPEATTAFRLAPNA